MSQTETLLVLALGSALTFLFFLLFGRIFWNLAMAAAARRRAREIPVEMLNLQADRDRMRAEHALMARKLELKLEESNARMAEQMAEVTRHRNRVQGLLDDIDQRDAALKQRKREIEALTTQLEIKDTEYDAARLGIKALEADAASHAREIRKLQQALAKYEAAASAAMEPPPEASDTNTAAPGTGDDGQQAPESRLRRRVAELTSISEELSQTDSIAELPAALEASVFADEPVADTGRDGQIREKLAEAERQTEAMQKELHALDDVLHQAVGGEPPAEAPKKQGAMADVISLAQRIRALQKGMND